ncbi:MAG TPA: hypothetical protein PLI95_14080 [Polyangiaceae bacterium]|nr:hypothetical protein [Polyangiaceae bacterium]
MIVGRARAIGWVGVICATLLAGDALAQVSAADRSAARALFDQARSLVNAGKHAEARPKFEESQRLDPGIGTLFNLADCLEATGKTASAWSMFLEVASQAKVGGQKDREKVARDRASAIEPRLSKLTVAVVSGPQPPGLEIKRDGSVVREALWGTPVAIDPGEHTIEASAPGRKKFATVVKVGGPAASEIVTIPALEPQASIVEPSVPAPTAASATAAPVTTPPVASTSSTTSVPIRPPEPEPGGSGGTQKTLGLVAGGLGVVALGVSGFLTLGAKGKLSDADAYCNGNECWSQEGVDLHSDAVKQANLATIVGGVGGVLLVGGAVLYFTAPSKSPAKASNSRSPTVGLGPSGVTVQGAW